MKPTIKQYIIGNLIGATISLTIAFLIITLAGWTVERDFGSKITYVQYVKAWTNHKVELIKNLW